MSHEMKRVVSISLGTSKRNKTYEVEVLGEKFRLDRIGTDGDKGRFEALMKELDGKVDALGIGGADLFVVAGKRKYAFRDVQRLISGVRKTPVVDGSGLKHTLEREAIYRLAREGTVDFAHERALLVSAVDRFGMASALSEVCPNVVYGDLLFAVGLPIPIRSYRTVQILGRILLPIVTRLPIQWFYPTGEKQEERKPKFERYFREADVICGDWHYIRRYAPDDLRGKTILTQTLRTADLHWLAAAKAARAITTTPAMGGETFATNVMEGVIVALLGKRPEEITAEDQQDVLARLDWSPHVVDLTALPTPEVDSKSP